MATENTVVVSQTSIKATYGSPANNKVFTQTIYSPQLTDTKSKAAYISSLRSSTKALQEDINKFLTAKMEEDKQTAGQTATNGTKHKARDEEEEENYGEENVEDD